MKLNFTAVGPNCLWVADMTYVPTWAGFTYLAIVLGVWSRRIVGWAIGARMTTDLVLAALNLAASVRDAHGVVHHGDHGSVYTSLMFGNRCKELGIDISMGSVGDACDAMAESFLATPECELIDRRTFNTHAEARMAVFSFIEGWYNPRRRHSALGYLSPMEFERRRQMPSMSHGLSTAAACDRGAAATVDNPAPATLMQSPMQVWIPNRKSSVETGQLQCRLWTPDLQRW